LPAGGEIVLTFDSLDIDFTTTAPAITFQSPSDASASFTEWDVDSSTLNIVMGTAIAENTTVVFSIGGTTMPEAVRSTSSSSLATFDGSDLAIDSLSNVVVVAIAPGDVAVLDNGVDFAENTPGIDTSLTLKFVVSGAIPAGGQIRLQFMDFIPTTNSSEGTVGVAFELPDTAGGSVACDLDGLKECLVTLDGSTAIDAGETVELTLSGITTPSSTQGHSYALLTTYATDSHLDTIDGPANVTVESFTAGTLQGAETIHFAASNPGTSTSIVVSFQTAGQILDEGYVQIDFPTDYGVDLGSANPTASFLAPTGVTVGSVEWRVDGLTVQIDGAIAQDETVEVMIVDVITPPSVRETSYVDVTTYDSANGLIDGPNQFQVSPIMAGSISPSADGIHLDVATPGVMGEFFLSFTASAATLSAEETILEFEFPVDLEFGIGVSPSVTFLDPSGAQGSANYAAPVLRITMDEASVFVENEDVSLVIHDVKTPSSIRAASNATLTIYEALDGIEKIIDGPVPVGVQSFVHGDIATAAAFFLESTPSVEDRLKLSFSTTGEVVAEGHIVVSFDSARFSLPDSSESTVRLWSSAGTVLSEAGAWTGSSLDVKVLESIPEGESLHLLVSNLTTPLTITPAGVQSLTIATLDDDSALIDESESMGIDEVSAADIEDCVFSSQYHAQSGMVAGMLGDATLRFKVRGSVLPGGNVVLLLDDEEWGAETSFDCEMEVDGETVAACSGEWLTNNGGVIVTVVPHNSVTVPAGAFVVVTVPGVQTPPSTRAASDAFIFTTNPHDDVSYGTSPSTLRLTCPYLCGESDEEADDDVDFCASYQSLSALKVDFMCQSGDPDFFGLVDGISSCAVPEIPCGLLQLGSYGDGTIVVVEEAKVFDFAGERQNLMQCKMSAY
jgi:hypothetical protein